MVIKLMDNNRMHRRDQFLTSKLSLITLNARRVIGGVRRRTLTELPTIERIERKH